VEKVKMYLAAAMVAVAVWLGWSSSASAQLTQLGEAHLEVREGAIQFALDRGTEIGGLRRISDSTRRAMSQFRPERRALLFRVQRGDQAARTELRELECSTACLSRTDQDWCRANGANEWIAQDLVLPCNEQTGACTRCSEHGGQCQWRSVQAISAYTCQSVRTSWLVRSARESARAARTATHLAEVSARAADLQRDGARRALTNVSDLLRAARERIAALVTEAAARSVAAEPAPTPPAPAVGAPRVVQERTVVARRSSGRPQRQPHPRDMRCAGAYTRTGLAMCRVPNKGLTSLLHSTSLRTPQIDTPVGMESFNRHLDANARAMLAQLLEDNPGAEGECRSPIIFYCRSADRRTTLVRRAGICRAANGNASNMTSVDFTALAIEHCGENPRIGVWGVPGQRIMLRLSPEAIQATALPTTASLYHPRMGGFPTASSSLFNGMTMPSTPSEVAVNGTPGMVERRHRPRQTRFVADVTPAYQRSHPSHGSRLAFASMIAVRSLDRTS
jgi:hypothetical protein